MPKRQRTNQNKQLKLQVARQSNRATRKGLQGRKKHRAKAMPNKSETSCRTQCAKVQLQNIFVAQLRIVRKHNSTLRQAQLGRITTKRLGILKNRKTRFVCISEVFTTDTILQCRFALLLVQPSKLTSENLKGAHGRFTIFVRSCRGGSGIFLGKLRIARQFGLFGTFVLVALYTFALTTACQCLFAC